MDRIGSLCTGYSGLDMAVERVLGGEMVWYSEFDKHPSTLLAQRFTHIPNMGDLTEVDWASLPRIDILTGGYPCQPFSQAGKRLGEEDPRHLWPHIRQAIRALRPRITFLENVAGHRSKGFSTVLRDCAEDGLHVRWVSVRASDVGAPHRRERLFFTITHPDSIGWAAAGGATEESGLSRYKQPQISEPDSSFNLLPDPERYGRLSGSGSHGGGIQGQRKSQTDRVAGCGDSTANRNYDVDWGTYEPAVRRWENVLGRSAPDPTEPNKNGKPRLTVAFDEWMMGLPGGWVDDIDIPYGAKIKLIGNGVVPLQAESALRYLTMNGGNYAESEATA